ncbi:caspase family protein [Kitasatospora sp. NPDC008050]|uniref:caspase family protein n=1 Tax=Kitasatospora sp. NPDC008050 TaxID=3364021 RepID=UPI0036EE228D
MRYLIAAGTRRYRHHPELPAAEPDVHQVVELFTGMGYQRVLPAVSADPSAPDFEDALADWCANAGLTAEDVVVLYYAGHGERTSGGRYRLACTDSDPARPRSWLSLPNLAEVFANSPLRNVLFVIDACHAAAAGSEIGTVTDALVAARARSDAYGSGTWVLGSARHRDLAGDGAFAVRLAEACALGDGPSQRYLSPATVADRVNQAFLAGGQRQRATCSSVDQSERPPFFDNPRFDPHAEACAADGTGSGEISDASSHFDPRGRGVEHVHDPGSYFTGRGHALTALRAHLDGPGGRSALVVTGAPGSGKSAVLGRLVLDGCADVSINARHQTLDVLVGRLAAAADLPRTTNPAALLSSLARREQPLRVVVDSLDEAGPVGDKAEARRIAWDLLRPLGAVACVRLVVGSRRELLAHTGERLPVVDLDSAEYARDTSTADYVARVLTDTGCRYEQLAVVAREIAEEVARRAGRCFLVARMTATALLRDEPIDTAVPGWAERLPTDVDAAFEAYLQRLPRERHTATMALLTALAFGEGHGLPRKLWAQVAARLSGTALTQAHIDVLLDEDGSYLASAEVAGVKYFRLYHQELTDHLKERTLKYRDLADIQECFTETLLESVPTRTWAGAHPYLREHLATHAAGSGAIGELVTDPSFVLAAAPAGLLRAVRREACDAALAMVIERCADLLGDAGGVDRAAQLAFVARTHGALAFAAAAEALSTSVERAWVEPREVTPHRVIGRHSEGTYSNRMIHHGWQIRDVILPGRGRTVLARPPGAAHVHVWFLDDVSQSTLLPHPRRITGLALLPGSETRPSAVTLDKDGTLRVWEIASQVISRLLETDCWLLLDTGQLRDGTPVIVSRNAERVAAFDLRTMQLLLDVPYTTREAGSRSAEGVTAFLVQDPAGHTRLLLCDRLAGRLTLHPLDGSDTVQTLRDQLVQPILADRAHRSGKGTVVAVYESMTRLTLLDTASGRSCAASFHGFSWPPEGGFARSNAADPLYVGAQAGFLVTGSLGSGLRRIKADTPDSGSVVPVVLDGRVYTVVEDSGTVIDVLDGLTGAKVGESLRGHESAVCDTHVLDSPLSKGLDILAIGNDGTARLWYWTPPEASPHEDQTCRKSASDQFDAEHTDLVLGWTAQPKTLLAGPPGLRRLDTHALDLPADDSLRSSSQTVLPAVSVAEHDCAEDTDGTINVLSRKYSGHININNPSDTTITWGTLVGTFVWHQLPPQGPLRSVELPWLLGNQERMQAHVVPPSRLHGGIRVVAFDAVLGQLQTLLTPDDPQQMAQLPWTIHAHTDFACSTAFNTADGQPILLVAVRPTWGFEDSVSGDRKPDDAARAETDAGRADTAIRTRGYLWNALTHQPLRPRPLDLPPGVTLLVPHHGANGTRYVAMRSTEGSTVVLDLHTDQQHAVSRAPSTPEPDKEPDFDEAGATFRWVSSTSGTAYLLFIAHTHLPAPVTVWDSRTPDTAHHLPPAHQVLWAGHAPNGEILVAVSADDGVTLYHLPSYEKVWSTPLPALVTSLTALPASPTLDLAIGTQQGVVLMRPRITPTWRRRLGLS